MSNVEKIVVEARPSSLGYGTETNAGKSVDALVLEMLQGRQAMVIIEVVS